MKAIGIIYEIEGNPYFNGEANTNDRISDYTYPTEINDILNALKKSGYNIQDIDGVGELIEKKEKQQETCSLFFNKSIGFKGLERKMPVPVIGQLYNLPIIGSSAYSMTLARHKYHTNRLLNGLGFLTPDAYVIYSISDDISISNFPVIVKPNAESDSLGIDEDSICLNLEQVKKKTKEILEKFGSPVIIEQFISGDEIKVAVIGNRQHNFSGGAIKVFKKGKSIKGSLQTRDDIMLLNLTYEPLEEGPLKEQTQLLARDIHNSLELFDYSRIDFRIGDDNKIYCMEVSTHPYLGKDDSAFTQGALQYYNTYEEIINAIIIAGRKRLNI